MNAAEKLGKNLNDITVLASTKTIDANRINQAIKCGIKHIGENRVQELLNKYDNIDRDNADIHFIGHLQSNKVKYIIDKVSLIHSVDSLKLAKEIDLRARKSDKVAQVLVEVNIGEEETKSGISPNKLYNLLQEFSCLNNISIRGLMTIPPFNENPEKSRPFFQRMYQLFVDIDSKKIDNIYMDYLSMGMSADYIIAIEEGANIVRIGTAIFGQRNYDKK